MYRATNATFDDKTSLTWSLVIDTQPAYCITQNADGSTSYLYMSANTTTPWSSSDWIGIGQPVTYNAINYGLDMNDPSGGTKNAVALQAAVDAAASGGGGGVFIPAGGYQITGVINVPATTDGSDASPPVGMVIEGCGGSTTLAQQSSADSIFSMAGSNMGRGVRIKNLRFSYSNAKAGIYAISSSSDEVVCEGCIFDNCPAMNMSGAHNGLLDCRIFYNVEASAETNGATMILMSGAANSFVELCYIYQNPVYGSESGTGPTGCTAIQIKGIQEPRVVNCNIVDFDNGITIQGNGGSSPNVVHGFISNTTCECNLTAITVVPSDSNHQIHEVFFNACVFERTQYSPTTNNTPGVLIDLYAGANADTVSDIFFSNCMSHDWAGPGMQINGGQDVSIIGGRYGQNATDDSMSTSGAIAVTGPAVRVSVVGVNCSALVPEYSAQPPAENTQPYSISVTGAVIGMQVQTCDLTENVTGALYVASGLSPDLHLVNCRGYNDQVLQLVAAVPASGMRFNGTTYGYFGPSTFYVNGTTATVSAIKVSNSGSPAVPAITTGLIAGAFRLDPHEWGEIDHSGGSVPFVLVGT